MSRKYNSFNLDLSIPHMEVLRFDIFFFHIYSILMKTENEKKNFFFTPNKPLASVKHSFAAILLYSCYIAEYT